MSSASSIDILYLYFHELSLGNNPSRFPTSEGHLVVFERVTLQGQLAFQLFCQLENQSSLLLVFSLHNLADVSCMRWPVCLTRARLYRESQINLAWFLKDGYQWSLPGECREITTNYIANTYWRILTDFAENAKCVLCLKESNNCANKTKELNVNRIVLKQTSLSQSA